MLQVFGDDYAIAINISPKVGTGWADCDRNLLLLSSEVKVLCQHRDNGRYLLLVGHLRLTRLGLELVRHCVTDTRQQTHKVELISVFLDHFMQRLNEPRTIRTVSPRKISCKQSQQNELEGHSVERTYLRQRCFDGSPTQWMKPF